MSEWWVLQLLEWLIMNYPNVAAMCRHELIMVELVWETKHD